MKSHDSSPCFRFYLLPLLLLFLASCGSDKYPVSFHMEAEPGESDKMTFKYPVNGKEVTFQKAGFVGTRDIESYRFDREEPGSAPEGVFFYLKPGATNRYQGLFIQNYGKLVLPIVNGTAKEVYRIGNKYNPVVPIFGGLDMEDLKMIKEVYEPSKEEAEIEKSKEAKAQERIKKLS